jgi:hypothetical protein
MSLVFDPKKHKIFKPLNLSKYKGQVYPTARSSWEYKFYEWCDITPGITSWAVESLSIDYYDPVKQKKRKYYPDVIMAVRDQNGKDKVFLVEIKPYKEVQAPVASPGKKEKTMVREAVTYQTNIAKWKAAEEYCKKRQMEFRIITEHDLFKDGKA